MTDKNKFYITTTLPYVNADPHLGFAAEIIRADVIARYQRMIGKEVFFNTGTDEHGKKIHEKAIEQGKETQVYCDEYALKFNDLKLALNLSYDNFVRTTDEHHMKIAQAFWTKCKENGYIYKKKYQVKYCVGCELEKTDSELVDGKCQWHPGKELEIIDEDNYFFKFSAFQDQLLELYKNNPDLVKPAHRLKEVENFVQGGLEDFSISRLKEKMPWGVPVPDDEDQVVYVWFDALVNYISVIGWPDDLEKFESWWPAVQVAGKDNLRQQSAMWQAMLMAVGLPASKQIMIFGFIGSDGQKMSKSIGNVVNPLELVGKYGVEATRYFILSELQPYEDSDFTYEKFEMRYTADLCNGLGNLVSRVSTLIEKNDIKTDIESAEEPDWFKTYHELMKDFNSFEAIKFIWDEQRKLDEILSDKKPWKMEDRDEIKEVLEPIAKDIYFIGRSLQPFMPSTAEKIIKQFSESQIKKGEPMFPRIS